MKMPVTARPGAFALAALLAAALVVAGCRSSSFPRTYPVTGSVTWKGGQPLAGGAVQFAPVADTSYTVSGDIQADGRFTLSTVKGTQKASGAPEGEYRVTVIPAAPAGKPAEPGQLTPPGKQRLQAITLPQPFKVEARENHFPIEIAPIGQP